MIEYNVNINGIDVNARYTEDNINDIFIPLLQELIRLQRTKKKRTLAFFAAPPGAGKSTLVSFLQKLSVEDSDLVNVQSIGMDGLACDILCDPTSEKSKSIHTGRHDTVDESHQQHTKTGVRE